MSDYITYKKTEYLSDLEYAKQFIFSFGSNYSLGVRVFPKEIRRETIFFYAFVRYPDELVDNPDIKMPGQTHSTIDEYIDEWQDVVDHGPKDTTHPILRSAYWVFKNKNIPFDYSFDFLKVMKQDMTHSRYARYAELEHYMWGSASVVGHVMTFIVGYTHQDAFDHARALGEAMQLANFLRDINEDYVDRDRIYLPQNDMIIFGVTEAMIAAKEMTPQLFNFIKHYCQRTEELFEKGIMGIPYLKHGGFSILLASRIYRENIRILKQRNYDVFGPKIKVSKTKKIWILVTNFYAYLFLVIKKKNT